MANTLSPLVKQRYTKEVQALLEAKLVSFALANTKLLADMPNGNVLNYPRPSYSSTAQYTKYTDMVDTPLKTTNETMSIDQHPYISFVIDIEDEQDIGYDIIQGQIKRNTYQLQADIDWNFFNEYKNAWYSNNTPVTLTTSNVFDTYGNAYATLTNAGVDSNGIGVIVDAFSLNKIGASALGSTFNTADSVYRNGFTGATYQGMKVFTSSNLTAEWVLDLSTQPSAGDTVTANGVVFTFVSALTSNPWDVLIGGAAADTAANFNAAFNNGAGAGTTYTPITVEVRANKLEGLSTVVAGTNVTLTSKRGYKVLSSSKGIWGAVTIHNIAMQHWAIELVIRNQVMLKEEDIQKQLGRRFTTHTRYGIKTFSEGAERMYDIKITAQAAWK